MNIRLGGPQPEQYGEQNANAIPVSQVTVKVCECCACSFKEISVKTYMRWARSVSMETGYRLDNQDLILSRGMNFSVYCHVQTGSGAHPASYSMGTREYFPERVKHPEDTSSVVLKHRENLTI
jgi:hypothetical protein